MINHKKVDIITDILGEVFEATENNLKTTVALGTVRNTPLAQINRQLNETGKESLDIATKIFGKTGDMLGISTSELRDENKNSVNTIVKQFKLNKVKHLRDDLYRATVEGISKQPKVKTKSGKMWGYKEYMEMSVRTTIANELGDMQLEFGGEAGVVFYLCNIFQDSADDHADYQGKYYYDERFETFGYDEETLKRIKTHINKNKILSMQQVRSNKPYLGTRPNCRHTFTPVSFEQASTIDPKKLSAQLGTITGTYRDDKYVATQELRTSERKIRNYKYQARLSEQLAAESKEPKDIERFLARAAHNKKMLNQWSKYRTKIVNNNPHLEKDYRRSTREKVLQDLGVKYNIDNLDVDTNIPKIKAETFIEDIVEPILESEFKNPSISIMAKQERDLDKFAHARAIDMVSNTRMIKEWEPVILSLANDFPEVDILEAFVVRRSRHTASTIGMVKGNFSATRSPRTSTGYTLKINFDIMFSNPKLKDYQDTADNAKRDFLNGHSSTQEVEGLLIHEMAHVIDMALSSKRHGIDFVEFFNKHNGMPISAKDYNEKIMPSAKKILSFDFSRKVYSEYRKTEFHKKNPVSEAVSRYARTSISEFFAEGFAKWYLSKDKDGEFEKAFSQAFYKAREDVLK